VSTLGVVPNLVIGLVAEPVGQGTVLPLRLRKPALHQQRLVRSHVVLNIIIKIFTTIFHILNHKTQQTSDLLQVEEAGCSCGPGEGREVLVYLEGFVLSNGSAEVRMVLEVVLGEFAEEDEFEAQFGECGSL
jgi:hypothetical protein